MKWPWWRGVSGDVRIQGRRLDGKAAPVTGDTPTGYGETGFLPSSIFFPTEGCWEVTGRVGDAELTFVTIVVKASAYALGGRRASALTAPGPPRSTTRFERHAGRRAGGGRACKKRERAARTPPVSVHRLD